MYIAWITLMTSVYTVLCPGMIVVYAGSILPMIVYHTIPTIAYHTKP